jgi:hypothetical protein
VYEATGRAVPAEARFDARHHNCSGKHAGFLAYCALHGLPTESYLDPQHPLQQRIRHEVARLLGAQPDTLATGTDGCSAPNLALPLAQLARLWAMVASGSGHAHTDACFEQIFSVMTRHPDMVSGTDRPDLHFSQAGRGDWVAKAGADGRPMFTLPGSAGQRVPFLSYASGAYMAGLVDAIRKQAGEPLALEPIYETDMAEGLKAMALEGHGLAFLPHSSVRKELKARRLVPASIDPALSITMEVRIYRERPEAARHAKPAVQSLWDYLGQGRP